MITGSQRKHAHLDVETIFRTILPGYGMMEREGQIALCHTILNGMLDNNISLSDAGTGIGKTYSYLVAGVIFNKYRMQSDEPKQAIVISTASIALQSAIHNEYIPFLSKALMEAGFIVEPILSVIRKGKSHYVCDERLRKRLKSINLEKKNSKNTDALLALKRRMDMDGVEHLSGYDRSQVAVPKACDCMDASCRYLRFLSDCSSAKYLFQICNHNLLLADASNAYYRRTPILPGHCAIILDEAHKLPGVARQMFGKTLGYDDVLSLVSGLRKEHFALAAQSLLTAMRPIIKGMASESDESMSAFEAERENLLLNALETLNVIGRAVGDELDRSTRAELLRMIATLSLFTDDSSDIILYTDTDERQRPTLCASAADLTEQIRKVLWDIPLPIVLTSGTLAVGDDFSRFRTEACLADDPRVTESISVSPFNYQANCLLYIPHHVPGMYEHDLPAYYKGLTASIAELIRASYGHALVLFNAYSAMSAVRQHLDSFSIPYPVYAMSRNSPRIMKDFKESGDGILLATGAAWEGFDFPGDMVSMLIIPRLPFPIPDAFSEYQKERLGSLKEFIHSVALPDMQIKLRQGFGRAIRLETDTCAVAILDERALRGRRYHDAVRRALPDMPITGSVKGIERFLLSVKDRTYFGEDA